jgi:hypothetical protein
MMQWKSQRVGIGGHKRVSQKMQDGIELSLLISGRHNNHPTNVIFSPKCRVTQILLEALSWILSQKYVIVLINCISALMCYINSSLLLSLGVRLEEKFDKDADLFRRSCLV